MIRLKLGAVDMASVRLAYSPLQEAVLSVWAWQDPARFPIHQGWVEQTRHLLSDQDRRLLTSLVGPRSYIPDYLYPRPAGPEVGFAAALEVVRATPPAVVAADTLAAHAPREGGRTARPEMVLNAQRDPAGLLGSVCDALQRYWEAIFSMHWPRIRQVLEGDVQYRSRQIATGGADAFFSGLDPALRWDGDTLHVDSHHTSRDVSVAGRGLPLSPSVFARSMITMVDNELPPHLTYPARGRADLWASKPAAAPAHLAELVGATRAGLLADLGDPRSTTYLAARHEMSAAGVSQHLHVLLRNGLLDRSRLGRSVLYRRTQLGDDVVAGQSGRSSGEKWQSQPKRRRIR